MNYKNIHFLSTRIIWSINGDNTIMLSDTRTLLSMCLCVHDSKVPLTVLKTLHFLICNNFLDFLTTLVYGF